jgi:hypothetical protein
MKRLPVTALFLVVAACGSSREVATCEHDGRTYRAGESFSDGCNSCSCGADGFVACTTRACIDAGPSEDAGPPPDAGLECASTSNSTLSGVDVAWPAQRCVFTVAEAAAGIGVDYDVVVTGTVAEVDTRPQASGCGTPSADGLIWFEQLGGGGQQYCLCDTGLCPGDPVRSTPVPGTHRLTFTWMGRNWFGPSDTGNPMGDPFPPGSYVLTVTSVGAQSGTEYQVEGTFAVHLVP